MKLIMEMKEEDAHDSVGCPADKNMTRIDPLNLYLIIRGNARIENQFGQVLGTLSQRSFIGGCSFILEDENLYKHKLGTFASFHFSSSSFIFYSLPPPIFHPLPSSSIPSPLPSFLLFLSLLFPSSSFIFYSLSYVSSLSLPYVPFPLPIFHPLPSSSISSPQCPISFPYLLFPSPMFHSLPLPSTPSTTFSFLPHVAFPSPPFFSLHHVPFPSPTFYSLPHVLFPPPCSIPFPHVAFPSPTFYFLHHVPFPSPDRKSVV